MVGQILGSALGNLLLLGVISFYTFAPRMAYVFSELVEVSPQYTQKKQNLPKKIHYCIVFVSL